MAEAGDSISILGESGGSYTKDDWGIDDNLLGFVATTSVSVNNTKDTVEAKNNKGEVVAVVVYNGKAEISIEGIGKPDPSGTGGIAESGEHGVDVGVLVSISEVEDKIFNGDTNAKMIVTESSVDMSNEDWVKYSIKGTVYELVTDTLESAS